MTPLETILAYCDKVEREHSGDQYPCHGLKLARALREMMERFGHCMRGLELRRISMLLTAVPPAIPPEAIQEADGSRLGQDSPVDSGSNVGRGVHPPLPDSEE